MIFLEVLFRHLTLYNHETGVDEGLLEELTLEHPHKVLDSYIFARRSFNNTSVLLYLLLLSQRLLRIGLALLSQGGLVLLKELGGFFERILRILAVNALVVELCRRGLHLREHLEHVVGVELASTDQREQEGTMWRESSVQAQLHHEALSV